MRQEGGRGVLAPGIYRAAGDRVGNTGRSGQVRFAEWPIERSHPVQRPKANPTVLEHQPVGLSAVPGPSLFELAPQVVKKPSVQVSLPRNPLRSHIHITTPQSSRTPLSAPLSQRLLGSAHGSQGWLHATDKGVLFCLGEGLVPSLAGPRTGLEATPAPKIR